jgi:hypothetical protein
MMRNYPHEEQEPGAEIETSKMFFGEEPHKNSSA